MSDKSSDKYEKDAPTPEEVKKGMKGALEAFKKNRRPSKRRRGIQDALKKAHPKKEEK